MLFFLRKNLREGGIWPSSYLGEWQSGTAIPVSSQVKLILSTQIQNSPPPPALARWLSSFSFWICLSRESTTNKCRMNSRCWGSRGLRRANDEARFSGSFLSLQLPRLSPILISLSWSDLKLSRELSLQSMVSTTFDGYRINGPTIIRRVPNRLKRGLNPG